MAEFQHFISRFNKISFTLQIPLKRGDRVAKEEEIGGQREGDFT
jgi:hypothetical protein